LYFVFGTELDWFSFMSDTNLNASSNDLARDVETEPDTRSVEPKSDRTALEKQLDEKLRAEIEKSAELQRRALYLQADLVNYQRQTERRIAEARDETSVKYIEEFMALKEDLERALAIASESKGSKALAEGLEMLIVKVDSLLESESVRKIAVPEDSPPDPLLHEVVGYSSVPGKKTGTVTAVIRNGYTFKGKVIKPALVEVARDTKDLGRKEIAIEESSEKHEKSQDF
jgi:molecular chaperone GrpE